MKRITLFIGLNDKDTKTQQISTIDAYKIVMNELRMDCTIRECKGFYTHPDGTFTTENSLEVMLLDFQGGLTEEWLQDAVASLKKLLNQQEIAVEKTETNSKLY